MASDEPRDSRPGVRPPRRVYEDRAANRDIDSAKRALTLKALTHSLPGGVLGAIGGWYGGYVGRWDVVAGVVIGFLIGFLIVFVLGALATGGAGSLAGAILFPSGKSTPVRRGYSYPESLAARGHYEDAITAYQECCSDDPADPEPYLRIARLYRDHLARYDEALAWFKRARAESALSPRRELLVTREIVEVYADRIGDPRRGIPELARLVDRFPDDPVAAWAKEEIAKLRERP